MNKPNAVLLTGFLILMIAVLGGVSISKGVFLIAKHEGDTLHLMQILLRMEAGQIPHLDFMTPIGIFAFAPIVAVLKLGFGVGFSILAGQILVAALLLPGAIWVGVSRLGPRLAAFFGATIMVLALALVHGEAQPSVSISMHYNRWAWGFAFIAIALGFLPPVHRRSSVADGVLAGTALAALAMIKVTYFAAFCLPVALGFLLNRQFRALFFTFLAGLAVAGMITLLLGSGFWSAYFNDLLTVAQSEVRPFPGRSLAAVLAEPAFLGGSAAAFFAVIFLRQGGKANAGLLLLLMLPGFFYVTWQNFGNDPQWLILLAVLILASLPVAGGRTGLMGSDPRAALTMVAVVALAMITPSLINLTYSPFRHRATQIDDYSALLPRATRHADLMSRTVRAHRVDGSVALDTPRVID